jgi:hypothetical protein
MQVEKVTYEVNWINFKVGYSIFIPCLNPSKAKKELMVPVRRLRYKVVTKVVIEDGVRGVRVWRV